MIDTTYAVVGGGIVGASVAYHLGERTDEPVALFDRGTPGAETTRHSFGIFNLYSTPVEHRMKRYGLRTYNGFLAGSGSGAEPGYERIGRLAVATTEEGAATLDAGDSGGDEAMNGGDGGNDDKEGEDDAGTGGEGAYELGGGDRVGPSPEWIEPGRFVERTITPHLDTDAIEAAVYHPDVGYFPEPDALVAAFLDRATERGVTVHADTGIADLERDGSTMGRLVTDSGETVDADEVVCAAGPWNVRLARKVGVDLPVRHTLAPVLEFTPPVDLGYTFPSMVHVESGCSWRGSAADGTVRSNNNPGGYDVAAVRDPAEVGGSVPEDVRSLELETTGTLIPILGDADVTDEWAGLRSVTPDGQPIVGWTDVEGFSIAALSGSGIQLAPAIGRIIARQLVDGDPTDYYDYASISRFDGYTDVHGGRP